MISAERGADHTQARLSRRLVGAVAAGTLLNPLNSSMIAVALVRLQSDFKVSVASAAWLISGFYLAAAVGQPLMGRLADQFGARRIFSAGLLLVGVTSVLAPFAPAFWWLVALRVVQAFGTSAAYPAGLAMIRAATGDPNGPPPAGALGALSIAGSVSAALGPVLGGFLVALAGWPAIFLVNVPVTAIGLPLALLWLPADRPGLGREAEHRSRGAVIGALLRAVDLPGIVLFSGTLVSLLAFLLSLSGGPLWLLLPIVPVAAVLLVWRERRALPPFLDVRMLAANRPLVGVYAQFAAVNVVFYAVFFGLPLWLQQDRGFSPGQTGLLLTPIAGLGVLATPVAARLISRYGPRPSLIVGALALTVGSLLLLLFNGTTGVLVILAVSAVLGIPNGFNNLGLQAALYTAAPADRMGAASGLFQTCRYIGAVLSTSLLGIVFGEQASSGGLHTIAYVGAVISALLVATSITSRRRVAAT